MAATSLWVQLFLALGWTVYVIYLPQLAAQAGLPKEYVPWLLLAGPGDLRGDGLDARHDGRPDGGPRRAPRQRDPLRLARVVRRVPPAAGGRARGLAAAPRGGDRRVVRDLVGAARAAAGPHRAPRARARRSRGPRRLFMLGLGIAGAVSPYLAVALKGADPRLPFALAAVALAAATVVMTRAIRANPEPAAPRPGARRPARGPAGGDVPLRRGPARAGLPGALRAQRGAGLPALREAGGPPVPDARVLDRLQPAHPAGIARDEALRRPRDDGDRRGRGRARRGRRGERRLARRAGRRAVLRGRGAGAA